MKKIGLLIISMIFFSQIINAENKYEKIESSVQISMLYNDSTFSIIPYLKIDNTITFSNYITDTLSLSLNKTEHALSFIEGFDVQELTVTNDLSKASAIKTDYNEASGVLNIIRTTPDVLNFSVNISYFYKYDINDFFRCMDSKFTDIGCELNNSVWYFFNGKIKYKELYVENNADAIFLCNAKIIKEDSVGCTYDISQTDKENELYFSVINRYNYKKKNIKLGKLCCDLYLLKSDSVYINTDTKKPELINERKSCDFDSLEQMVIKKVGPASDFFNKDVHISIIETRWGNTESSYGRAYGDKGYRNGNIRCDSRFLSNSGITHEVIHFLCDIRAKNNTEGYLFFNESIIETFVIYSLYKDNGPDSVFNETYKYYVENFDTASVSIFDIEENAKDYWGIIYFKIPYVLYGFSKENNYELFWNVFSSFMKLQLENASWQDFENYFIEHGYSDDQMKNLKNLL